MDWLFSPMGIFIKYPVLAALVGIGLVALGRRNQRRLAVGVGAVWLLYALYEFGIKQRWLCTGECNIRIDLLVIFPALLLGLVAAGVSLLRGPARTRPPA
jgi:hypothetical protein